MKITKSKKHKLIHSTQDQLPNIYSPTVQHSVSRTSSQNNPASARTISSNTEVYYQPPPHYAATKPMAAKNSQTLHQIMIEFIPDKYSTSSNTQVNFMANPVIPSFAVPPSFPSLNLN